MQASSGRITRARSVSTPAAAAGALLLTLVPVAGDASASSTGGGPALGPVFGLQSYLVVTIGGEAVFFLLVACIAYFLPSKILTKLASRLYGFEAAVTPGRSPTHRKRASVPMTELSVDRMHHLGISQEKLHADTNRTHLLAGAQHDSAIDVSDGSSGYHNSASPRQGIGSKNAPLIFLRTSPHHLWIMGQQIDFDPALMDAITHESANEPWSRWFCYHGVVSTLTGQCFGRGCCSRIPDHPAFQIRRYIRQLLLWSTFVSICLFFTLAVMANARYTLPSGSSSCPLEIVATGPGWDCFVFAQTEELAYYKTSYYVDCTQPLPATIDTSHDLEISCFRFMLPSAESYLSSLSTVAALFTLVMGGTSTVFAWWLTHLQTRWQVRLTYLIPIVILIVYLALVVESILHTSIALMTPIAAVAISTITIKIRMVIGFQHQQEEEDEQREIEEQLLTREDETEAVGQRQALVAL
jgi:hypothetical protein